MPPTPQIARAQIEALIQNYRRLTDADKSGLAEANVVHQFITPLLRALGWPVDDPHRCKFELNTVAGRPDITLIPESGGALFVEAKRFGLIQPLAQMRQTIRNIVTPNLLALPGMAVDRTQEEQQAINYAFQNGGAWAILTNFEKLRLFNARRDWLVFSFESPGAYLDEFDLLWQLSYEEVCRGGLDALSNQRHREDVDTNYLHFINTWRERLAQEIIARRADNPWAFHADGSIRVAALRSVVQRILDRLVVVRFAEDHTIIPADTLWSLHELRGRNPYTFSLSEFIARLFRRFDEEHNSALFAPDLADDAVIGDEVFGGLIRKLYEARYRALSADIMGNTYEQYLGKTLVQVGGAVITADNVETRKKQGSYYTPQVIVRYLVDNSLGRYLYATADGSPDGEPLPGEQRKTHEEIRHLRVIDPACGSGSFLIYAYAVLADFYRREIARLEAERQNRYRELVAGGMTTPFDLELNLTPWSAALEELRSYPRLILEHHLYGVDLDPQAAEIATVNLMVRGMADQPSSQRRLPLILNQNIKVGNSLIGAGPDDARLAEQRADLADLRRLRLALTDEKDGDHAPILDQIRLIEDRVNARLNEPLTAFFADVAAQRPFHWAVSFPEVFVDETGQPLGEDGGFDVVIGNPPWEIVKPEIREYYAQFDAAIESKLSRAAVEARIAELDGETPVIPRGWAAQKRRIEEAAAYYRRSPDFYRQGRGDTATHKLFLERGYSLLERSGRLGFVIPSGIYSDLGTKEMRQMLLEEGRIEYLYSFSNERFFFPDVHHSFKFTLLGAQRGEPSEGFWATFRFNPRVAVAPEELTAFLHDQTNLVYVKRSSLMRFSPDSLSVMEFTNQTDADVTAKLYAEHPLLGETLSGSWNVDFAQDFHITNDRALFNQDGHGLPLYEGKVIHQFDAFYAQPKFWIEESMGRGKLENAKYRDWYQECRVAFREIARSTEVDPIVKTVIESKDKSRTPFLNEAF
ncbi:MAG: N-6 DNA methylase [Caldilineaceae bacterium]|nr:N-6 DNA methylase [Caldilineaceae bacterium]